MVVVPLDGTVVDLEAARRPPSTPGLSRRSGRIPALPYPPIKPLHCTAIADMHKRKINPLWKKTALNPRGFGGQSPHGSNDLVRPRCFPATLCHGKRQPAV